MAMAREARHIGVSVERPPADVYAFAADPRNLPRWAKGLGSSIEERDGRWVAESPLGTVTVRFAPPNAFGVLDHDVVLESGATFHNPMRVVPNGDGSEVVFTLFRQAGTSDAQLEADASAVERDLRELKALLEGGT